MNGWMDGLSMNSTGAKAVLIMFCEQVPHDIRRIEDMRKHFTYYFRHIRQGPDGRRNNKFWNDVSEGGNCADCVNFTGTTNIFDSVCFPIENAPPTMNRCRWYVRWPGFALCAKRKEKA